MAVQKLTISFGYDLAEQVKAVAEGNVSAWLADAAQHKLRLLEASALLHSYEADHGEINEKELVEVRTEWPV